MAARMRICLSICFSLVATSAFGAEPAQPQPAPVQGYYYPPMPYGVPMGPAGYPLPVYPAMPVPNPVRTRAMSAPRADLSAPAGIQNLAAPAPAADDHSLASGFRIEGSRVGPVLATADGRTLYASADGLDCRGGCSTLWTPLLSTGADTPSRPFGRVERKDGSRQWTYEDRPLFQWVGDEGAGDVTGDGVDGVWFAVRVRGG